MKTSDLYDSLNGLTSGATLSKLISNEVDEYKFLSQKKGSSIPLHFNEDRDIVLTKSFVRKLLNDTQEGNLSNIHLAYICDCLTLGEKVSFEYEFLKDIIYKIADPEINGGFKNYDEISKLIDKLS